MEYEAVSGRLADLGITSGGAVFWNAVRGNIANIAEAKTWFDIATQPITPIIEDQDFLATAASLLPEGEMTAETWGIWTKAIMGETGLKGRAAFMPLRQALTAASSGPELAGLPATHGAQLHYGAFARGRCLMSLYFHNTLTRQKSPFTPLDPDHIRIYACGPTVYDRIHVGNARPVVLFDVLVRLLRHHFPKVTYVRNITDVDDKINARAAEKGISIRDLTEGTTQLFHEDCAALKSLAPDVEPRATDYIQEMITMITSLIEKGHAYAAEGHVLFHVASMPDYGQLSRRTPDELAAGARVEIAPYKKDAGDFVLWKPSDADQPGWESPWGYGRPGWHIECSAMSATYLGEVFDIHAGGLDLIFPHHENEIAHLAARMADSMVQFWMVMAMSRSMAKKCQNRWQFPPPLRMSWKNIKVKPCAMRCFPLIIAHH